FQAELFANRPDKCHITSVEILPQGPRGDNQCGAAHAIIKRTGAGARSNKVAVLLGNGDEIAGLDAELSHVISALCSYIQAQALPRATRPLEVGFFPAFRQLQHPGVHAVAGMDQNIMTKKIRRYSAAFAD